MHRALADLAGLTRSLELLGDLLQKLRPPLLIDRPGQLNKTLISSSFSSSGTAGLRVWARTDDTMCAATSRASWIGNQTFGKVSQRLIVTRRDFKAWPRFVRNCSS
jgi:hypothetical protein